ncbi:hypothetical protein HHI36_016831 [Cryptolaemus montrouzieri]|uniref:Uncharacterized protein n=1 Tax=Cryptolaemus montrouzieri TaxID=559131 RepID=A0ABD2NL43_9CUCU
MLLFQNMSSLITIIVKYSSSILISYFQLILLHTSTILHQIFKKLLEHNLNRPHSLHKNNCIGENRDIEVLIRYWCFDRELNRLMVILSIFQIAFHFYTAKA